MRGESNWLVAVPSEAAMFGLNPGLVYYDPLSVVGLHRSFAKLGLSEADILMFATQYGLLGREMLAYFNRPPYPIGRRTVIEALSMWRTEIVRLRSLIALWDAYRSPNPEALDALGDCLDVGEKLVLFRWFRFPGGETARQKRVYAATIRPSDTPLSPAIMRRVAARLVLQSAVNEELANGVVPAIEAKAGGSILLAPKDLLGSLYTQLAQEIIGRSVPAVSCAACGAYFVPEHGRQRYCDERCKFKGYRQRKKQKQNEENGD